MSFSVGGPLRAAQGALWAADPSGVAPTDWVGAEESRAALCRIWRKVEADPYEERLSEPQLRGIQVPDGLRGSRLALWAQASRHDVAALVQEREWDEEKLEAILPGIAAATKVVRTRLWQAVRVVEV